MAWKNIKQRSMNNGILIQHKALTELDDILKIIKWHNIEKYLVDLYNSKKGERAYPPLMIFKALLLQSWYNLSNQQLASQLARDLLFRRFVGTGLDDTVPDHSSIWRFRQKISEEGRLVLLLDRLNQGLTEAGLLIKPGQVSIIDASVIEAKQSRPHKGADDDLLKQKNLKNGILKRAYRNRPLTKTQKQHNQHLSSIRSTVERVFGILKLHYGMGKARYLGRARNHARLLLMSMTYNLKRGLAIQRSCMAGC
jgi:IS5 family transposase